MTALAKRLRAFAAPLAFAGLLAAAGAAAAQDFTPSQLAAARSVITATHMDEQFDAILPQLAQQAKQMFISRDPANAGVVENTVNTVALELAKRRPELNKAIEAAWAARFTEDELKQMAAFYNSPLGVKINQYRPAILKDSFNAARAWQDALSADLQQKVAAQLEKPAK